MTRSSWRLGGSLMRVEGLSQSLKFRVTNSSLIQSPYADLVDNVKFIGSHISILWATCFCYKASQALPQVSSLRSKASNSLAKILPPLACPHEESQTKSGSNVRIVVSFSVGFRTILSYCPNFLTFGMPERLQT